MVGNTSQWAKEAVETASKIVEETTKKIKDIRK
jgi:hypothetical protein